MKAYFENQRRTRIAFAVILIFFIGAMFSVSFLFLQHDPNETLDFIFTLAALAIAACLTLLYALRKSEEKYRGLVEHASDGIFITDVKGKYLEANLNGCFMLGYTRDELLSKYFSDLILPEDLSSNPLRLDELQQGKVVRSERRMLRKDGSPVPVESSECMLPNGTIQSIQRDITWRKQEERVVEKRNQMLLALHNFTMDLGTELQLPVLLKNILINAQNMLSADRGGGVYLYDAGENAMKLALTRVAKVLP